jgi:hypothetical protein
MGVEIVGRGCAKQNQHLNREPGVFVVAAGEFFAFRPDWHQDDRALPIVRQYQTTLDAILPNQPGLASCAVFCRHCGIRFLTHPRNAHRRDLGCPFGCREHQRRRQANARSKRHYATESGRRNKKRLNGKRSAAEGGREGTPPETVVSNTSAAADTSHSDHTIAAGSTPQVFRELGPETDQKESRCVDAKLPLDGFTLREATLVNSPLLPYLAMIASVIEGRAIRAGELLSLLLQSMRQRSFDSLPRREYVLHSLKQHPP